MNIFEQQLKSSGCVVPVNNDHDLTFEAVGLAPKDIITLIKAGMATFSLHVEARIASALGQGTAF